MENHPYEWLSLVPSLVAVTLAIITRRVVLSMLIAIFVGAMITKNGNPIPAISDTFEIHLWKSFSDEDRLRVYAVYDFDGRDDRHYPSFWWHEGARERCFTMGKK